jgi:hypothetical protein
MKRFDVQHCHLTEGRMVDHVEPTLHQGRIDPSRLHGLERLLRAGHRLQLDRERMVGRLPPQRLGDPVPRPPLLPGGHPQSDGSLPRLVEGEEDRKADCHHPEDGEQAIADPLAGSRRPIHRTGSCSVPLSALGSRSDRFS